MMTDTIADMLTRIRNALMRKKRVVEMPSSRMKKNIAEVLKREGFIKDYEVVDAAPQPRLRVFLKYTEDDESVIRGLQRVGTPGRRVYSRCKDIKPLMGGGGIYVLSTSSGVMSDKEARKKGVGGEVLLKVW